MASFGKVLDLLDERYLNLQDVVGNVEPLPTLVPYEEYEQNVLVYRMDTSHELFMALIQDFTERAAQQTGKELWAWCVQWDVGEEDFVQDHTDPSSPKKARLDSDGSNSSSNTQQQTQSKPMIDIFNRRVLAPELLKEEDMLRILIDLMQVESSLVPNFIEFLYRTIDFYEGDGQALKAALKWEIPSLWDFDYHPLVLPADIKKQIEKEKLNGTITDETSKKTREKPDLAAFERQIEETERLQYREVKYGIQPPQLHESLPPLINIPRDHAKRLKYYAACFKSRQRAMVLLLEGGISMQQVGNYKKSQDTHPRETSGEGKTLELIGLRNYFKDAAAAQEHFRKKENFMIMREKQREIALSRKLAFEAHVAAQHGGADNRGGITAIPEMPPNVHQRDRDEAMMAMLQSVKKNNSQRIGIVPSPLVGMMKSKLFQGATDQQTLHATRKDAVAIALHAAGLSEGSSSDDDSDSDSGSDSNDDGPDTNDMEFRAPRTHGTSTMTPSASLPLQHPRPSTVSIPPSQGLAPPLLPTLPTLSDLPMRQVNMQNLPAFAPRPFLPASHISAPEGAITATEAPPAPSSPTPASIAEYIRNMNVEQAQSLLPLLNGRGRNMVTSNMNQGASNDETPAPSDATIGTYQGHGSGPQFRDVSSQSRTGTGTLLTSQEREEQVQTYSPQNLLERYHASQQQHASTSALQQSDNPAADSLHSSRPEARGPPTQSSTQWSSFPLLTPLSNLEAAPTRPQPLTSSSPHRIEQLMQRIGRRSDQNVQPNYMTSMASQSSPLSYPRPNINRTAPSPLNLFPQQPPTNQPCSSPLSTLAPSLLCTTPFLTSPHPIPIQIYLPKIVVPGNGIGPNGARLGDNNRIETDAFLLGYSTPASGEIVLSRAIFLPVGVWENTLGRVRKGSWKHLETYPCAAVQEKMMKAAAGRKATAGGFGNVNKGRKSTHKLICEKLTQAYNVMRSASDREAELTKRWRVTKGPLALRERGAVWEGWAVTLDRAIELGREDRSDALVSSYVIDDGIDVRVGSEEEERRRREVEELLEEEEMMSSGDEMEI